jgi:hypothetical protein
LLAFFFKYGFFCRHKLADIFRLRWRCQLSPHYLTLFHILYLYFISSDQVALHILSGLCLTLILCIIHHRRH